MFFAEEIGPKLFNSARFGAIRFERMAGIESYGISATVAQIHSGGRGRPTNEYWLNEGQALVISTLSNAPNAAAVRKQIIESHMTLRRMKEESSTALVDPRTEFAFAACKPPKLLKLGPGRPIWREFFREKQ